jgi:hypothetical protein
MNNISFPVNLMIKISLNKDFSDAMSTQIILYNVKKCSLDLTNLDKDGYFRLVDSIISDYININPLGDCNTSLKKRELLSGIETTN